MVDENILVCLIDAIYRKKGFDGVIKEVENRLEYGEVKKMNGLYRITTGGWSDDESLLHTLCNILCTFSRHYCGYTRGGAYYFCQEPWATVEMVRVIHGDY